MLPGTEEQHPLVHVDLGKRELLGKDWMTWHWQR